MLILNLVTQEWKKNVRAQGFYKNLAVNLLLGFFGIYVAVILLFLGFSLNELLEKVHTNFNPTELFNGAMIYIVLFGLTLRFFMQQLSVFNLPPYQVLPIKRSSLINFLLLKPLVSPANYFLLLVVVPFAIKSVIGYYSTVVAIRFVLSFIFVVWFNSFTATFLKRKFGSSLFSFLLVLAILGSIIALEFFKVYSLFALSMNAFGYVVFTSFGFLLPLLAAILAFGLNKWFFSQNYYSESFNKKMQGERVYNANISFLDKFGAVGELIAVEIKLILRHKRTKSMLYMSTFFLFYGLIFYTRPVYVQSNGLLFFVAMFLTGLLMFMYGQWVVSWDSSHFDCIMTKNVPIRTYIQANYYLLIAFNILCFVLTTPYFYFGMKIMYMHLAAFIFNMGVNVYFLLFLCTFNTKRIDLTKTSAMNYQGTTFKSFLIIMPIMFVPMLLVGLISTLANMTIALWTLTIIGFIGILLRNPILNICINQFNRRKYKLAEGFRESI